MVTGIETIKSGDKAAWLAIRGQDVTASVVAALFDCHPFITRFELWARKTGALPRDDSGESEAMRRGRLLEPVAVALLREREPGWRIKHNASENTYYRDPAARIGATPDVIARAPGRGLGVVQIKSVEAGVYARQWAPGGAEPEAPEWIMLQATVEAYLVGAKWAAVAPLIVGHGLEMPLIEVPLVPEVMDAIKGAVRDFWRMVEAGKRPPPDYGRDGPTIDRMYAEGDDDYITDLSGDPDIPALLESRADAIARRQAADATLAAIDAQIKDKIGEATAAHIGGGRRITWQNRRRPGGYVAPSAFRALQYPTTNHGERK